MSKKDEILRIKADDLQGVVQPVLLRSPDAITLSLPAFEFDGHEFQKPMDPVSASLAMSSLYLAKKARGGDRDAVQVLDSLRITVKTADGSVYYPPDPSEVEDQNRVWQEGDEE